jgi:hypothetical protein
VALAVAENACRRTDEIARSCVAVGLRLTAALPGIGVIVGSIEPGELRRLWSVPDVIAIEVEHKLHPNSVRANEG